MRPILDSLQTLGSATLDPLWLPMVAWTLVTIPLVLVLIWWKGGHPFIRYRSAIGLLVALPIGLGVATTIDLLPSQPSVDDVMLEGAMPVLLVLPSIPAPDVQNLTLYHALGLLVLVFAMVAMWRLSVLGIHYLRLLRFRRRVAGECSDEVQHELDGLAQSLGIRRRVRLVLAPDDVVPMTFGFRRPQILLPRRLLEDAKARRVVLSHELIHVSRHDYLFHTLEQIVVALFAWHPLVLLIDRQLHVLREMACDAEVLRLEGVAPRQYAELLYSLLPETPTARTFGMAMADVRTMKTRILAMKTFTRFGKVPHLAAALLTLAILAGATTAASQSHALAQPERPPSEPHPANEPLLSDSTEVFVIVEQMPELIGGLEAVQQNLVYPDIAARAGIEGKVFVQFIVDEEGNVVDPVVTRGIGAGCDEAALQAVKDIKFKPGMQRGVPVQVKMSLPVMFKLPGGSADPVVSQDMIPSRAEALVRLRELKRLYENDPSLADAERISAIHALEDVEQSLHRVHDSSGSDRLALAMIRSGDDMIGGRVVDASGAPVALVNVVDTQTEKGAVTDGDGFFEIRIPGIKLADVELQLSHVSYSTTTIDLRELIPAKEIREFRLQGAYPDPFNPTTTIRFDLPAQADVQLEVFDLAGRRVHVQTAPALGAGAARMRFDGSDLASGVYLYRITAQIEGSTESVSGRFTLLK